MHADDRYDDRDDELKNLIDQALATYAAEPSAELEAGLEARIIAEARTTPMLVKKPAAGWWWVGASGMAAAAVVTACLLHLAPQQRTGPQQTFLGDRAAEIPSGTTPVQKTLGLHQPILVRQPGPRAKHHRSGSAADDPREVAPPMAGAVTEQEQMLVELATHHPAVARELIARAGEGSEPLHIEPLHTEPITVQPIITEPLKIAALQIEPLQ